MCDSKQHSCYFILCVLAFVYKWSCFLKPVSRDSPYLLCHHTLYLWPLTEGLVQWACNKYLLKGVMYLYGVKNCFYLPCGPGKGAGCGGQIGLSVLILIMGIRPSSQRCYKEANLLMCKMLACNIFLKQLNSLSCLGSFFLLVSMLDVLTEIQSKLTIFFQ